MRLTRANHANLSFVGSRSASFVLQASGPDDGSGRVMCAVCSSPASFAFATSSQRVVTTCVLAPSAHRRVHMAGVTAIVPSVRCEAPISARDAVAPTVRYKDGVRRSPPPPPPRVQPIKTSVMAGATTHANAPAQRHSSPDRSNRSTPLARERGVLSGVAPAARNVPSRDARPRAGGASGGAAAHASLDTPPAARRGPSGATNSNGGNLRASAGGGGAAPQTVAACHNWCARLGEAVSGKWCKCRSCAFRVASARLPEGAPCREGSSSASA